MSSPYIWIGRCVIECISPLSIGSGGSDDWDDAMLVTDHDGVPVIPGSSLAGALRAAYQSTYGCDETDAVFGHIKGKHNVQHQSSLVEIGFGWLAGQSGSPRPPGSTEPLRDPLLVNAQQTYKRNHVRLSDLGVVDGTGLHDANYLPLGHRFHFELRLRGDDESLTKTRAHRLISLLNSPAVTLGSGWGVGQGQFKLMSVHERLFDLSKQQELSEFGQHPADISQQSEVLTLLPPDKLSGDLKSTPAVISWTLKSKFAGAWLVAGGDPIDTDIRHFHSGESPSKRVAQIIPWREGRVVWGEQKGRYEEFPKALIPGSSIRGALRHRVAYHLNRIYKVFADKQLCETEGALTPPEYRAKLAQIAQNSGQPDPPLWELFGGLETDTNTGKAGRLVVEDVWPRNTKHGFQDHVTIDRLSGGAYRGHLFDESIMWGGEVEIKLHIEDPQQQVPPKVRLALGRALDDLAKGHLALGGGTGRGHGHLSPSEDAEWSDGGDWINPKSTPSDDVQGR